MQLLDFFFEVVLVENLLCNTDNLSHALQKKSYSVTEGSIDCPENKGCA